MVTSATSATSSSEPSTDITSHCAFRRRSHAPSFGNKNNPSRSIQVGITHSVATLITNPLCLSMV